MVGQAPCSVQGRGVVVVEVVVVDMACVPVSDCIHTCMSLLIIKILI